MLVEISRTLGSYLHDVFVIKFDGWVVLGFVAQGFFTMRFLVQWIASERAGRSIIPTAFWIFSIAGGVLLTGIAGFVLASAACALAPTAGWLIAANPLNVVSDGLVAHPFTIAVLLAVVAVVVVAHPPDEQRQPP